MLLNIYKTLRIQHSSVLEWGHRRSNSWASIILYLNHFQGFIKLKSTVRVFHLLLRMLSFSNIYIELYGPGNGSSVNAHHCLLGKIISRLKYCSWMPCEFIRLWHTLTAILVGEKYCPKGPSPKRGGKLRVSPLSSIYTQILYWEI